MRDPRPRELAFLRSLLAGPRRVSDGPVGTCVKRGWCRPMPPDPAAETAPAAVLYALTDPGRDLLASACPPGWPRRAAPQPGDEAPTEA